MTSLFLDAAGWLAAISPREAGHAKARKVYESAVRAGDRLVTTPLVIAETHALLMRWRGIAASRRFLRFALEGTTHTVVDTDGALLLSAVDRWIDRFDDKPFSLCDAVSFEVMRRERITRALTLDKHFAMAGFDIL